MSKPRWSKTLLVATELGRQAEKLRTVALEMRCDAEVASGARCTGDEGHDGGHRHDREDLPR